MRAHCEIPGDRIRKEEGETVVLCAIYVVLISLDPEVEENVNPVAFPSD